MEGFRTLKQGSRVAFEIVQGPKGDLAQNIRPVIDDVRYESGAILWYVARSKVTRSGMLKLVGTKLYANMTIRNCNTLRKLDALMQSGG